MKLELYHCHLKPVLLLYFKDESLALMLLLHLRLSWAGQAANSFFEIIDHVSPLSSELRQVEAKEGFFLSKELQNDPVFPGNFHRDLSTFKGAAKKIITMMPDAVHWYAKVTLLLVKHISDCSR